MGLAPAHTVCRHAASRHHLRIAHFRAFGFVVLRGCYSATEMAEIERRSEALLRSAAATGGTDAHTGVESPLDELRPGELAWESLAGPFLEPDPRLTSLCVSDARVTSVLRGVLGEDFIFVGSEFNRAGAPRFQLHMHDEGQAARRQELGIPGDYTEHGWHSDRAGRPEELAFCRIKTMLYLQPTKAATGSLRVIPGSHMWPLHKQLNCLNDLHATTHGCTEDPVWQARSFGVRGSALPAHACEVARGAIW